MVRIALNQTLSIVNIDAPASMIREAPRNIGSFGHPPCNVTLVVMTEIVEHYA